MPSYSPVLCYFYPRSPCGERPTNYAKVTNNQTISIHALLAESDRPTANNATTNYAFLSTLSLRRATSVSSVINNVIDDFYPRSPCGERLRYDNYNLHCVEISIHALLAESDIKIDKILDFATNFYPRSPCGERQLLLIT